jgi:alpha-tubulin suppressor-like RCC1 family protein
MGLGVRARAGVLAIASLLVIASSLTVPARDARAAGPEPTPGSQPLSATSAAAPWTLAAPAAPAVAGRTLDLPRETVPGDPGTAATAAPTATAIAAGYFHTCALLADHTVWCWGQNGDGQLGNGTRTSPLTAVKVSGISTANSIAAGAAHSCALLANGTVWCWGDNYRGQLGVGTRISWATPVQVSGISTATAIVAGDFHTCAALADGTVWCWGANDWGQLGYGITSYQILTPVRVWGGALTTTAIAAGDFHTCALWMTGGSVVCWGMNISGQLGDGGVYHVSLTPVWVLGISTATAITAGDGHTCAVLADGTARCWGWNGSGELGDGTTTERHAPVDVSGISTATAIDAGSMMHTCGLLADHTARCWGLNDYGQLGDGTTTNRLTPVAVSGINTATAITAGYEHTCALLADHTARCWGSGEAGQLGDGTWTDSLTPVVVALPADTTPPTATLDAPASPTNAATLSYGVTFSEPVTGLGAADFTRTGTAGGCSVGAPSGSGEKYTVGVIGCGTGTVVLALGANTVADLAGNPGPTSVVTAATVIIDRTAPTATAPAATLRTGVALSGSAIPVRLAWSGSDAGGAGIARYELTRSTNGGVTWTTVSTSLVTLSASVTVPSAGTIQFRVRAVDRADNIGAWATGRTLSARLVQQSSSAVKYAGTWTSTTSTAYSGGSVRYAKVAGRSASYTFTGRSIALVTTTALTRGKVKVYVNGTYVATVDLYRSSTQYRVLAWQKTWSTSGTRTVKLVVAGTSGRPRVDLDGFAVLK